MPSQNEHLKKQFSSLYSSTTVLSNWLDQSINQSINLFSKQKQQSMIENLEMTKTVKVAEMLHGN